jgi:hypothetical protein
MVLPKGREEYGPAHGLPDREKVHDQYENDGQGPDGTWLRVALMERGRAQG